MQRGGFSTRLAFIFAASGSAVGLGNIWRIFLRLKNPIKAI